MKTNILTTSDNEISDEIANLEKYARKGEQPPLCKGYEILVNRKLVVMYNSYPTGRDILSKAEFVPPEDYTLRVVILGSRPKKIGLDEKVDLTMKGIEKFKVLPRDQTEG